MTATDKPVVGFIGLGTMGHPMVTNVVKEGFDTIVYDVDATTTRRVAEELGTEGAESVAGLARSDVIVLMLPTSAIVRSVLVGEGGETNPALRAGTVIVDMSS